MSQDARLALDEDSALDPSQSSGMKARRHIRLFGYDDATDSRSAESTLSMEEDDTVGDGPGVLPVLSVSLSWLSSMSPCTPHCRASYTQRPITLRLCAIQARTIKS